MQHLCSYHDPKLRLKASICSYFIQNLALCWETLVSVSLHIVLIYNCSVKFRENLRNMACMKCVRSVGPNVNGFVFGCEFLCLVFSLEFYLSS